MTIIKHMSMFFNRHTNRLLFVTFVIIFFIQTQLYSQSNMTNRTNISNQTNNLTTDTITPRINNFIRNLGKNISNTLLKLTLEPQDIAYAITGNKIFNLTIENIGDDIFTLKVSDDYVHNVFMDVYDELHLPVTPNIQLMIRRNNTSTGYRSITLFPADKFTVSVILDDFINITKTGVFKIVARFFPEKFIDITNQDIKGQSQVYIESNPILISVVNDNSFVENINRANSNYNDIYRNQKLITREANPYDVIEAALTELKNKNWDNFFTYLDATDLYVNVASTRESFHLLSTDDQQKEIVQYLKRLKTGNEISDIYPPEIFTIEETRYTPYNANVIVNTKRTQNYALQTYRYKFILKKKNTGWKIVNYTVTYTGMESIKTKEQVLGNAVDYPVPGEIN